MKIFQPQIQRKTHSLVRHQALSFSTDDSPKPVMNTMKGQHIRYIPKERLRFDFISPEGPLHLFYNLNADHKKRLNNWKISTAVATPATIMAYFSLGP